MSLHVGDAIKASINHFNLFNKSQRRCADAPNEFNLSNAGMNQRASSAIPHQTADSV